MMITLEDIWEHEGFQCVLAEMRQDLIGTWERAAPGDLEAQHLAKLQLLALERFRSKLQSATHPPPTLNKHSAS